MSAPPPEARIDGRTAFAGRILSLEVDRVRLASGGTAVREVVRHPGAAVIVPRFADGSVALVRQYRYAVARELLELPAGKLAGPAEEPIACARRELAEETGLAAGRWTPLVSFFTAPGFCDELLHCFLAEELEPVSGFAPDDDERIEVVRMPLPTALDAVAGGEIHDAKTIVGLLLAVRATPADSVP